MAASPHARDTAVRIPGASGLPGFVRDRSGASVRCCAALGCALFLSITGCAEEDGEQSTPPDAFDPAAEDVCAVAAGMGVSFDPDAVLCNKLSSYRFFVGDELSSQAPNERVVPFDLNTPLFSDYATKYRFLWIPEGATVTYDETESFGFPVGSVLIKTFAYPADLRDPSGGQRIIETRLLMRKTAGWEGVPYVWTDDQSEALLQVAGHSTEVSWIHLDGTQRQLDYNVPNKNQCKQCHAERDDEIGPIGPKARHLNRDIAYEAGTENQLVRLTALGLLVGAPEDPIEAPRAPMFDDSDTGTIEERARSWLDINCSHCHNPRGLARTSGLELLPSQDVPYNYGVCKAPVAAGAGSGGRQYNIVPGDPEESLLVYRIESVEPAIRMPELGRSLVHEESAALIRQWIAEMPGECATD